MQGLMMDMPLLLSGLIEYAADCHGATEIVSRTIEGDVQRYGYADAHRRIKRLAKALLRLGAKPGMRIGTLAWNRREHFEMFYGVAGPGRVLHTVNPRLFPDQLVYIINHAEDEFVFCDAATLPIVEAMAPKLATVKRFVVMAPEARMPRTGLANLLCYETLLAAEDDDYAWPQFDERNASTICYTSGDDGQSQGRRLLAPRRRAADDAGRVLRFPSRTPPRRARSHDADGADVPRQRLEHALPLLLHRQQARPARPEL